MRQCDVFVNPSERASPAVPFVIVLQSDAISHTATVVVGPLVKADGLRANQDIYPIFQIEGVRVALSVTELATLPRRMLKHYVTSLDEERYRIIKAIDLLFTGV